MNWTVQVGERRSAYNILVGKPQEKKRRVRPEYIWKGNIKTSVREIGREAVDCIKLDRVQSQALVNTVMNFRVP
jgi:hypothetical protein